MASRLTAILKGPGVGDNQDDTHAIRRAELDEQFRALPLAGRAAYWHRIEGTDAQQALPLEVLARCFRERNTAGVFRDAERVFNVMWLRVQPVLSRWAWTIAGQARSGMKPQLKEDLEQECYVKLWEELNTDGPTFLLVHFAFAFGRLRQHVAHDTMEKAGEWQRSGVKSPTRIPRDQTDSMQADPEGEDDVPLTERLADTAAQNAFDQAELSDLLTLVMSLPADQRTIVLDRFWYERSQAETAEELGISDRMLRYRLQALLRDLGVRYRGGEEDNHA